MNDAGVYAMLKSPPSLAMRSGLALRTSLMCSRDRVSEGLVPARGLFVGVAVTVSLFYCHSWLRRQVEYPLGVGERLREVVIKQNWPVVNCRDQKPDAQHAFQRWA